MNDKLPEKPSMLEKLWDKLDIFKGTREALDGLKKEIEDSWLVKGWNWVKELLGVDTIKDAKIENLKKISHKQVAEYAMEACDYYGLKGRAVVPIALAFVQFESGFNANAVNKNSGATGLGQFIPKTGKKMLAQLPAEKFDTSNYEKSVRDPEACTWMMINLVRQNAKSTGINLNSINTYAEAKDAVLKLYIAHNSGPGNVKAILAAQKGDYSLLDAKTGGDKDHWLYKRVKTTTAILRPFDKFWKELA